MHGPGAGQQERPLVTAQQGLSNQADFSNLLTPHGDYSLAPFTWKLTNLVVCWVSLKVNHPLSPHLGR